ncbi:hypothetical protein BO78DRAFT_392568 [Aspergillus sclerotiicarbonarius CBS 121057]|uniref:Bacteriophage T5 Orf172 DNA-binding domain-containing protein n=1 Tax=Aspergillus sclerotiicarbonarius (strain CBS 121057 / IBT 28362) TaxID=1448318 RepID=A0A319ETE1_ASPSB|nr:hypothetical protein BO78DRAFT_392568 [Aspergillus sclerotiicarbonarius CBS 121057]
MASQSFTSMPSRNISPSSYPTLDDKSPLPNHVANIASGAGRSANPRDESASPRPVARREVRPTTTASPTQAEGNGHTNLSGDMTVQRYLRNTVDVDQTIVCLEQILSGTPFQSPRPCDPPSSSIRPASETLPVSLLPGDMAQDLDLKNGAAPFVTEDIILELRNIMTREYKEENRGFAYVYRDCKDESQYFKIGSTDRIQVREKELQNQCKHTGWELIPEPKMPIWQYKRLERLAQSELKSLTHDLNCACSTKHREYFRGSNVSASEVLERWSRWFVNHEPYDKKNRLKPFWAERLETFTTNKNALTYFNCHGDKCSRRESKPVACQECLRAGWKAWTEPTMLEKAGYSCQTYIRAIGQRSPVPTCLLGIVGGRLFVPMLLVLLQGYEVSFKIVFDFTICICLLFCYSSRHGGFKSPGGSSSPSKRASSAPRQPPMTPDTNSSSDSHYSARGKKRKLFKQPSEDDIEGSKSPSDSNKGCSIPPKSIGLDRNILGQQTLPTPFTTPERGSSRLTVGQKRHARRRRSDIH